ncbi:hypothetical protein HID58_069894, partial [Brassica napus]
ETMKGITRFLNSLSRRRAREIFSSPSPLLVSRRPLFISATTQFSTSDGGVYASCYPPKVSSFPLKSISLGGAVQRRKMFIQTQSTPNPSSLMFSPGKPVMEVGSADFPNSRSAMSSPLAKAIFSIDGVVRVFFGSDFVTVTKSDDVTWDFLKPEVFAVVMDFYSSGQPLFMDSQVAAAKDTAINEDDSETVAMIKELLETRIRPSVQDDGGDIEYCGFDTETGIVKLRMQGACSGCPSSSVTLKSGIENMLMHYISEVLSKSLMVKRMELRLGRWSRVTEALLNIHKKNKTRGIVTQTGAYFFLAASVPLLGSSSSAMATLAKEHTAAAAAVNIRSLLIFMVCSFLVVFSLVEALTTVRLRLSLPETVAGSFETAGRNEDVMVIDAIANCDVDAIS